MVEFNKTYYSDPEFTRSIENMVDERLARYSSPESYYEKYLEIKFANIDYKISHLDYTIAEIKGDLKELRTDIRGLKSWIIGTAIALATLFFAVVGYHTMVMQSQMQTFSEYVKAVVKPPTSHPPSRPGPD